MATRTCAGATLPLPHTSGTMSPFMVVRSTHEAPGMRNGAPAVLTYVSRTRAAAGVG